MGYVKLFDKLIRSSIWDEDDCTRVVWITMLAMADANGEVRSTERYLALAARVSEGQLQESLKKLLGPDDRSTSKEYEGRRVEVIEGGWRILNHGKYRQMMRTESRREYQRQWQAQRRKGQDMTDTGDIDEGTGGLKGEEKGRAIAALTGFKGTTAELIKELRQIHGQEAQRTEDAGNKTKERLKQKIARLEAAEAKVRAKFNPGATGQTELREDEKGLTAREIVNKRVKEDPITKADQAVMKEKWGKGQ